MISLLIPTREKFNNLNRCIKSFIDNCKNINNFEILLGMDFDDTHTINMVKEMIKENQIPNIKIIESERMYYANFHKYMQNLYEKSSGELIWLLADDIEMKTQEWDDILISRFSEENFMYSFVNILGYENWPFSLVPLVNKKWFEITGRISENSQTDLWLGHIAKDLNIIKLIPEISVDIFQSANGAQHNSEKFYTSDQLEWNKDKEKIKQYLNNI